jgi:hypothetical protein
MRAIGTITACAGPEYDLVAPRGSPIRTADVSEETGLAFHTARFLGTAPRGAPQSGPQRSWWVLRGVPSRLPGCHRFGATSSGPLREPVSRPGSASHLTGGPKPACKERPKPKSEFGSPARFAWLSRLRRAGSVRRCRGPKLAAQQPGSRMAILVQPVRRAASRARDLARTEVRAGSLRRGRGPSSPVNRRTGSLFVLRRGRWPLPPRQQHSPRAACVAPECRHYEKFPRKPGCALVERPPSVNPEGLVDGLVDSEEPE